MRAHNVPGQCCHVCCSVLKCVRARIVPEQRQKEKERQKEIKIEREIF